jgi:outer membrane protein assembly factor BamA
MKKIILCILCFFVTQAFSLENNFFPALGYTGDSGFLLGGIYNGAVEEKQKYTTERTEFNYLIFYTTKHQISTTFQPKIQLFDGLYQYEGEVRYENWPSSFYPIGINSTDQEYTFIKEKIEFKNQLIKRINKFGFILGSKLTFVHFLDKKELNSIELTKLPFNNFFDNYTAHHLTFGLQYDSRDDATFPTKGFLHELKFTHGSNKIGSDENIDRIDLDLRGYVSLNKNNVFAFQSYGSYTQGQIHLLSYKKLAEHLRGFKSARYLDKDELGFRAEYRFFPFQGERLSKLGFVVFSELGTVEENWVKNGVHTFRNDFGTGIRWTLSKTSRLNIKLDIAFQKNGKNIDISAMEAF